MDRNNALRLAEQAGFMCLHPKAAGTECTIYSAHAADIERLVAMVAQVEREIRRQEKKA